MPSPTITIVLAEDHAVVRSGLRFVLDAEEGLEVVAEAGTIDDAVRPAKAHRPPVLVLDLNMPGSVSSSLEVLLTPAADVPSTRVVVLTMQEDPQLAKRALTGSANAYVLNEAADTELVELVRYALDYGLLESRPDPAP